MDAEALQQTDRQLDALGVPADRVSAILEQFARGARRSLPELDTELEALAGGVALGARVAETSALRSPAPAAPAARRRSAMEEALAAVADSDVPPATSNADGETSRLSAPDVEAMLAAREAAAAQAWAKAQPRSSLELDFDEVPALAEKPPAPHLTAEELFTDSILCAPAEADPLGSVDVIIDMASARTPEESLAELLENDPEASRFDADFFGEPAPTEDFLHTPLADDYDDSDVRTAIASPAEVASLMAEALESVREQSVPGSLRARPASVPPRASTRPEDWGPDPFADPLAVPPVAAVPAEALVLDEDSPDVELVFEDDVLMVDDDSEQQRQLAGSHIGPAPTPTPDGPQAAEGAQPPPGSIPPTASQPPPAGEEGAERKSFFRKLFGK